MVVIHKHCEVVFQVARDYFHAGGKAAAKCRNLASVMADQQIVLGEEGGIQHVESQGNVCSLEQFADRAEVVAGIRATVAERAADNHIVNPGQLRLGEIAAVKVRVREAAVSGLRFLNEFGHMVNAVISKTGAVPVQKSLKIAMTAACIQQGAACKIPQLQQHLEAPELALRSTPSQGLNASGPELADAVAVVVDHGGFFDQVHRLQGTGYRL